MFWIQYPWSISLDLLGEAGFESLHHDIRNYPNDGRHVWVIGKNKDI
jgi:hypothetical protein